MKHSSTIFSESKFYNNNSKFFTKNLKKILLSKKINYKKATVLDYGCGNCLIHRHIKFRQILLYDIAIDYKKAVKVNNSQILQNFNDLKKNKKKFDLIIVNSVIQYISPKKLKQIFRIFLKKIKKNGLIIVSDIPAYNRYVEFFYDLNIIFFLKAFFYFLARPRYFNLNFYTYKTNKILNLINKRKIKIELTKNLNFFKSRYTLLISKKIK